MMFRESWSDNVITSQKLMITKMEPQELIKFADFRARGKKNQYHLLSSLLGLLLSSSLFVQLLGQHLRAFFWIVDYLSSNTFTFSTLNVCLWRRTKNLLGLWRNLTITCLGLPGCSLPTLWAFSMSTFICRRS